MRHPRLTIGGLLILVMFLAFGFAALRAATEAWDSGALGVTLAFLLMSVLLAIHRAGASRAYWLGFALFGCPYLGLLEIPSVAGRLPTTRALAYFDSLVAGRHFAYVQAAPTLGGASGTPANPAIGPVAVITTSPAVATLRGQNAGFQTLGSVRVVYKGAWRSQGGSTENFIRIGHSLLALVLAFLGAVASRSLYLRERRGPAPTAIDSEEIQETSTSSPTS